MNRILDCRVYSTGCLILKLSFLDNVHIIGRPFVKRSALLSYRCSVCLSVLSVTLVYCGQMVGRIKMKPSSALPKKGKAQQPPTFRPMYCGQTAGWIKMPLGTEVVLDPGHTVLDGDPAPNPPKGHSSRPLFSAHVHCGQTVAHLSYL